MLLIISRKPILLVEPRLFWDESTNYAFAFWYGPWKGFITPHQGYFSFINNITALIQRWLISVENAPYVSTYMALGVQLLPHLIIWLGKCPYWAKTQQRALASIIVLFTSADCVLWLNVVTSQFHLSLVTFLILIEDWHNRSQRCKWIYACLLLVAGTTGVVSSALTPFFLLRWYQERGKLSFLFAATMVSASMIALVGVISFKLSGEMLGTGSRFHLSIIGILYKFLIGTVGNIFFPFIPNDTIWKLPILPIGLTILLILCAGFANCVSKRARVYFLGMFFWLSMFSLLASLNSSGNVRYFYASNTALMLMVLQGLYVPASSLRIKRIRTILTSAILLAAILPGMHDYYFRYTCYSPSWPKWRDEVKIWRQYPEYRMRQHPINTKLYWAIEMPPVSPKP